MKSTPAPKPKLTHQAATQERTARHLMEALDRMKQGKTVHLPADFKWTKTNWAKEADVHITTPLRKDRSGDFVFKEANLAFDQGSTPVANSTIKKLRLRITELEATNVRLHKTILELQKAQAAKTGK